MLPSSEYTLNNVNIVYENTKSYKMDLKDTTISGFVDETEALKQAIYKILNTERNMYPMYSRNYGIDLKDLIGLPTDYAISQIPDRITEALIYDDRIVSVDDFEFSKNKSKLLVKFKVTTIYGNIETDFDLVI